MQAHEPAPLEASVPAEADPIELLSVENFICLQPLPHFGHSMRSALERTTARKAQDGGLNGVPAPFSQNIFRLFR